MRTFVYNLLLGLVFTAVAAARADENPFIEPAILLALFGCATLLFDFWILEARQRKWLLLSLIAMAIGALI